jgi:2-polyprenyl-6-methoxyphenol hydroxylase-like FAD-dependent oxidoreductase
MSAKRYSVCVVGSGITAQLAALLFTNIGCKVEIYENFDSRRGEQSSTGFSCTEMSETRLNILDKCLPGLGVREMVSPVVSVCWYASNIEASAMQRGMYPKRWTVATSVLRDALSRHLGTSNNAICVSNEFCDCNAASGWCTSKFGHCVVQRRFDLVVVTCGVLCAPLIDSLVRQHVITVQSEDLKFSTTCMRLPPLIKRVRMKDDTGVIRVRFQPSYAFSPLRGVHIWYASHSMLTAVPVPGYAYALTLLAPLTSCQKTTVRHNALQWMEANFPAVLPFTPSLETGLPSAHVSAMNTVRTAPLHSGRLVLLGSAAHAEFPCPYFASDAALCDVLVLHDIVLAHFQRCEGDGKEVDFVACAAEYTRRRQPELDTLADLCDQHYRDLVAEPGTAWQQWYKGLLDWLGGLAPTYFAPIYVAVAVQDESSLVAALKQVLTKRWWYHAGLCAGSTVTAALLVRQVVRWVGRQGIPTMK